MRYADKARTEDLWLWCVQHQSRTMSHIPASGRFAVISCRRWLLMVAVLPLVLALQAGPSTAAAAATGACRLAWVTNWHTGTVAPLNVDTRAYGTTSIRTVARISWTAPSHLVPSTNDAAAVMSHIPAGRRTAGSAKKSR